MNTLSRFATRLLVSMAIAVAPAAVGQDWPKQKPVQLVVGFAAGSSTDIVARVIAQKLTEALGQSVVVENKGGAGGNLAAQLVKGAQPNGYTILVTSVAYAVNPSLYPNAGYDPFNAWLLAGADPDDTAKMFRVWHHPHTRVRTSPACSLPSKSPAPARCGNIHWTLPRKMGNNARVAMRFEIAREQAPKRG